MIAGLFIALFFVTAIILAVELNDCVKERNEMRNEARKHRDYHEAMEAYMMPVSQENIKDFLLDSTMNAKVIDENTMTFEDGNLFVVDTERLPMLHIKTGYNLSGGKYDWDMVRQAAAYVRDRVVMVETSVTEGHSVEFHISCCENNIGHLNEAWQHYRSILLHSMDEFVRVYNHLHDNAANEAFMKKDSPEAQIGRFTERLIAEKTEEAEMNARNNIPGSNCLS